MRAKLLSLLVLLSLPAAADIPPVRKPSPASPKIIDPSPKLRADGKHKGSWYFSTEGHAVFCYGPTMYVKVGGDGLQKVATFCRGDKVIVPLHD